MRRGEDLTGNIIMGDITVPKGLMKRVLWRSVLPVHVRRNTVPSRGAKTRTVPDGNSISGTASRTSLNGRALQPTTHPNRLYFQTSSSCWQHEHGLANHIASLVVIKLWPRGSTALRFTCWGDLYLLYERQHYPPRRQGSLTRTIKRPTQGFRHASTERDEHLIG